MNKLAFVWDWEPEFSQAITWKDGLAAAVKELSNRFEVGVFTDTKYTIPHEYFDIRPISEINDPDAILIWGDMTRPHIPKLAELGKPMAICFAGGELFTGYEEMFDHIFVESEVYRQAYADKDLPVSIAFGTNTELFKPIPEQHVVFDVFFPATYALWKRHSLLAQATQGLKVCTSGYMYPDSWEKECYEVMEKSGALVLPHLAPEALVRLYSAASCVVVPSKSSGGSQRTVLEALACEVPVIVTDSDKFDWEGVIKVDPTPKAIISAVEKCVHQLAYPQTREYIEKNWSHITYADSLEEKLNGIINTHSN